MSRASPLLHALAFRAARTRSARSGTWRTRAPVAAKMALLRAGATVVVPGSRAAQGKLAKAEALALYAPVIVKYRDERTDAATLLEEALR